MGCHFLPNPGMELVSLELAGGLLTTEPPGKPITNVKTECLMTEEIVPKILF